MIKFTVESSVLSQALTMVGIVGAEQQGGYLFQVHPSTSTCDLYARSGKHEARVSFNITDVEGEGAFIYPVEYAKTFKELKGSLNFSAFEEEGSFKVRYEFGGSGASKHTTIDPRSMTIFEKDLNTAKETIEPKVFEVKVLQFALSTIKSFMPKNNDTFDQEYFKTVKIFGDNTEQGKRSNGFMLASNSKEICYFYCSAFLDKDLSIPLAHLSMVESFLAKSFGQVQVFPLEAKVYMINANGDVLGWPKMDAEYKKFSYYSKTDEVVVSVDPVAITSQLKIMHSELGSGKTKIRMHFEPSNHSFQFSTLDEKNSANSLPVDTEDAGTTCTEALLMNVNVEHMLNLFSGVKGNTIEFRIKKIPATTNNPRDRFMFRTIDDFYLDSDGVVVGGAAGGAAPEGTHLCNVTRFAPGID